MEVQVLSAADYVSEGDKMKRLILVVVVMLMLIPATGFAQELFINSVAPMNGHDWVELTPDQKATLATGIMYGLYWANVALLGYDADNIGFMTLEQFYLVIETVDQYYKIPANRNTGLFIAISTAFVLSWN